MYEKATVVCFIYMQPQKMEFKSVQINMKHILYFDKITYYVFKYLIPI